MNKAELITTFAEERGETKAFASDAVNDVLGIIQSELVHGGTVELKGFGSFKVRSRPAREGHDPRTGKPMTIAARRVVTFKPSSVLLG